MWNDHGRDGNGEWIGRVQRSAIRSLKEGRLNAKFNGSKKGRYGQPNVSAEGGSPNTFFGIGRSVLDDGLVNKIGYVWQDNRHVKAIGADCQDTTIAKKDGLNNEGNRNSNGGDFWPKNNGSQRTAYCMPGGTAGQRYIEHHDHKREGSKQSH
ncbi:hypothetical protein SDC9_153508 [bioreactor metagenome]|uniref:Uncharacterized protein n=1 Tax=bioreactor metagenome TaxID=1076179 RepID=A0A645EYC9_9ZZZZ